MSTISGPLTPPGEPGAPTPDDYDITDPLEPDNTGYAPSVFMSDYEWPTGGSVVIPPMPRSDGGLIQSVKTAIVLSVRDALSGISSFDKGQKVEISLEYPLEEVKYPSIFVQFSVTKLNRSGIGHEIQVQDPDTQAWSFVQEWTFTGRTTLTALALKNIDRDRLSDALVAMLAFARPPELLLTNPQADAKQHRSLITALDENPYVAMTLQLDTLIPGGQQATPGTPWSDDILTYQDSWSFDMVGQFNLQLSHEGMYTLARIDPGFSMSNEHQQIIQSWQPPAGPPGPSPFGMSGQTNVGNTNYPAM